MSESQEPHWLDITQDSDLLKQFLDNQANEIVTRQTEQELRKQQFERTYEYSLKVLEARLMDRQREREHQRSTHISGAVLVAFLSLLLSAGICYALHLNKDQLVMEFVKAILFIVTGGVGGYSIKTVRDKAEAPKQ